MTNTLARIRKAGKNFEIIVDLDQALSFKKGQIAHIETETDRIFTDSKKGNVASNSDLQTTFGTTDFQTIVAKIVKEGEVQVTQEYRSAEQDKKFKQIIDFLTKNAIDPISGTPHTPQRIQNALEEAHVNVKNTPIDSQIGEIMDQLRKIIPIKIETKRVKITIPAIHTGKAYGVVAQYKENEQWLNDGSLKVVVGVPAGIVIDFYEKLNSVTHGSALTQEMKE